MQLWDIKVYKLKDKRGLQNYTVRYAYFKQN